MLNLQDSPGNLLPMETAGLARIADDVREQILNAAEGRFHFYGYGKTTMAEIARDVRMSAANLYRYFENKQDLAAACVARCMDARNAILRQAVRAPGLSAAARLEAFVRETLHFTHRQALDQPKVGELVEIVCRERLDLVRYKEQTEQSLLAEILEVGNQRGEFAVADPVDTARAVHASILMFDVPIFMSIYSLEQFEKLSKDVVELLVRGLARR